MIVYGAAGRRRQEAQLLLNKKVSAEKQSTPLDHFSQLLPLTVSTIPPLLMMQSDLVQNWLYHQKDYPIA